MTPLRPLTVEEQAAVQPEAEAVQATQPLELAIRGLLRAIRDYDDCIDHLDCSDDAGAGWYAAIDAARSAIGLQKDQEP